MEHGNNAMVNGMVNDMIYAMVYGYMVQVRTRVSIVNESLYTETVKPRNYGMVEKEYALENLIFLQIKM